MPPSATNPASQKVISFFINMGLPPVTSSTVSGLPDNPVIAPGAETKAADLFAKHYSALKNAGRVCSSRTVSTLAAAVTRANLAYYLWAQAGRPEVPESEMSEFGGSLEDFAGSLQLLIFRAANWLRRFAYERNKVDHWFNDQEMKEATDLADELQKKGTQLITWLDAHESKVAAARRKAVEESEAKWQKQEQAMSTTDLYARKMCRDNLLAGIHEAQKKIKNLRFFIRELEDSRGPRPFDEDTEQLLQQAKTFLTETHLELETPSWRNKGMQYLGPLGIVPVMDPSGKKPLKFLTTNWREIFPKPPKDNMELAAKRRNGRYTVSAEFAGRYKSLAKPDGTIDGLLSPLFFITIKRTDDTFKLIRIPEKGVYFAWAYPVLTSQTQAADNFRDAPPTSMDLFLTLGGYVYFDSKLEIVQANAINVAGSQLQFSAPFKLQDDMLKVLEEQNRFAPITLEGLSASHFAWILPGEFSEDKYSHPLPVFHPGAFAYKYEDPSKNNYFIMAAVDTVTGKQKVETSLKDD